MRYKFIVKPPTKKEYQREFLIFKKNFEAEEEFTEKEGPKTAKNLAKKAVEEGFDRIILVGGDGLLNEGINGIIEATQGKVSSDFAIGTIPTGSGNNFAKELGIPKDIKEAFKVIKNDKKISIDIGRANDRYFINCISFGFDGLVNKIANEMREKYPFLPRQLSYLIAALKEMIKRIPEFEIKIKGDTEFEGKTTSAAVTNSRSYGGIFKINPGAKIDDGKFNICLIESVGRVRALFDIYQVIKGTHINLPEVKMSKASSLIISSPDVLPYEIDGEVPESQKEYKIEVFPRILPILVP